MIASLKWLALLHNWGINHTPLLFLLLLAFVVIRESYVHPCSSRHFRYQLGLSFCIFNKLNEEMYSMKFVTMYNLSYKLFELKGQFQPHSS